MFILLCFGIILGVIKALIEIKEKKETTYTTTNLLDYIFDTRY
jgi:hypothetical protein